MQFNRWMEPAIAASFFVAALVCFASPAVLRLHWYALISLVFAGYGFAGLAVFTIIDASIIPAKDYQFPSILCIAIAAAWMLLEGIRLVFQKTRRSATDELTDRGAVTRSRRAPRYAMGIGTLGIAVLLIAQWVHGMTHPPDTEDDAGRIEAVDANGIRGWARWKSDPARAVEIEIYIDDALVATMPAELWRPDLKDRRIGTGRHGFEAPLPAALRDGKSHKVVAKIKGSNYSLAESPLTVSIPPAAPMP
jgi:hypothetical protein